MLQNQVDVTCYRAFILPHCGLENLHVISGRTATEHFGRFATKHSGSGIAGTPTKLAGDTAAEHVAGSATEPRMTDNAERLSELDLPSDLSRNGRSVLLQSKPTSLTRGLPKSSSMWTFLCSFQA